MTSIVYVLLMHVNLWGGGYDEVRTVFAAKSNCEQQAKELAAADPHYAYKCIPVPMIN